MTRLAAMKILQKSSAQLKRDFPVKSLHLFGSVSRNDASAKSDVDLLVEFTAPVSLFEFLRLKDFLETRLKRRVDLVTRDALREELRAQVERELIRAA